MKITRNDGFIKSCNSILEGLEIARVIKIVKNDDGTFYLEECCDGAFGVILDKDQMIILIRELLTLMSNETNS